MNLAWISTCSNASQTRKILWTFHTATSLGSTLESVTTFTKKMQLHKNCSNFSQFLSYARIPKVPLAIVLPKVPLAILALFLIICAPKRSARAQGLSTTDSICMQRKGLWYSCYPERVYYQYTLCFDWNISVEILMTFPHHHWGIHLGAFFLRCFRL